MRDGPSLPAFNTASRPAARKNPRRADAQPEGDTGDYLRTRFSGQQGRQPGWQEPLPHEQHADCHQQNGNRVLKPVVGYPREQASGKPSGRNATHPESDHGRGEFADPNE
jgi:hypothetical protein